MSSGRLLFVESNTTPTGPQFMRRARDLGFEPVLLTGDAGRYRFLEPGAARVVAAETSDTRSVLACARSIEDVAGVTSSSEYYVATAAAVARDLRLPGPSPLAMRRCASKKLQRLRLAAAGVPGPAFAAVRTVSGALRAAARIGYPVVVKPTVGSGSVGVRACATERELAAHASGLLRRRTNERGLRIPQELLVEGLVEGPEYSVELFAGEVVGMAAKHLSQPPWCVELGHDFPAALPDARERALADVATVAARALGATFGAAHVEVREGPGGPAVIEVNARLAGGSIPRLVEHALGIDLVRQAVRRSAGLPAELSPSRRRGSSIRFLVAPEVGRLASVAGLPVAGEGQVAEVLMYKAVGDEVGGFGDFRDRIGHVITVAPDVQAAQRAAEQAMAGLRVVVEVGGR